MAKNTTYEVYSFKNGKWTVDAVHTDRDSAMHDGQSLIASKHSFGVKVIQETIDTVSGDSKETIILQRMKNEEKAPRKSPSGGGQSKPAQAPQKDQAERIRTPAKKREKPKRLFGADMIVRLLLMTALIVGGIITLYYIATVGG